ncbi:non-reducing end alpha-L-arabinofuranosidase family hydrolase [Opitutus terrae]|uniref:non-reducing end alpha-L-arabinofuranosidase n=1 Tax=Opitutus terrae (strain DSM 11246 / JCM 15787 / PB90-1) TaxID=452637 RepID=B1ZT63_OPITP|nr:non-reducing end alpha-L-arabinofuranosidase family hydrolase [Opitutus terrae]ACB76517.1 glycoside hydrolase family 62 [Opitutus terrae PB90-1]
MFTSLTRVFSTLVFVGMATAFAWQSDNGDGTFTNPPLYADYPDPDIIRVGEDFYFVTTTFVNTPGLRILHSQDLVNWEIVAHVVPRLDGREQYDLTNGTAYRNGVFAPSLRYHNGTFYLAVTPNGQKTRIYHASDVRGPWEVNELDRAAFDPALFIESDGTGYIVTSGGWDGTGTLLTLDPTFSRVVAEQQTFYIRGAEGSKIVRRGDWYYLFNSIPSRLGQTVSRSKSLSGPWETRNQLDDTKGGHQGAIVDLPDGRWFGFIMRDSGSIGRMTNLSPIYWQDDWPVWGSPTGPDQVPAVAEKPVQGQPVRQPATSDEFDSAELGLQWAWNHNPDNSRWSLSERPGFLRLKPTQATEFWTARNTLTQKGQGPWSRGEVKLDLSQLKSGVVCGFGTLGKINGHISVSRGEDGGVYLSSQVYNDGVGNETRVARQPVEATEIFLRAELDFQRDRAVCSYSLDGASWTALGGEFPLAYDWRTGTFQGAQFAIFCYSPQASDGFVDVDWFRFTDTPARAAESTAASIAALAPFAWTSTGPLISPVSDTTHSIVAVKDPTIVYGNGKWHVYATTADTRGNWSMAYFNFRTWAEAANAKPYYIDQNPNLRGYHCAPQVFYFRPHKKWYLIYQSQHPTYSTADDLEKPETWTAPQPFFNGTPKSVVQGWIDYWIICDETHAYLFFSDDWGRFYRSRTKLEDFPRGFDEPVVIMQDANRFNLFEASCIYRVKGTNEYLCFIEALGGPSGKRYFRGFTSNRLDGEWKPLAQANSWETPFAGPVNVNAADGGALWSVDISHGELLRDGNDETMTIDPDHLYFLYQGRGDAPAGTEYSQLPYRLGLLQSTRAKHSPDTPPSQVLNVTRPQGAIVPVGGSVTFSVTAESADAATFTYQWRRNGADLQGATSPAVTIENVQPENAGYYTVLVSRGSASVLSEPAVLELSSSAKVAGGASEVDADVHHQNGNVYDQVLLNGASAAAIADPGQILRMSYVDLDDDIVQVEFSGAGTVSLVLDGYSASAPPAKYNQSVSYVKGNAGIVITGADDSSNLSIFSVGRITAVNQALFRDEVSYDGFADLAYVAIASANGRFGGLRAANAGFRATAGLTGVYAPGVEFAGPVFVNDITAFDAATPVLLLGAATDVRITGGALAQDNGRAVAVSGFDRLQFTNGSNSHGAIAAAQPCGARLERYGLDVTARLVSQQ